MDDLENLKEDVRSKLSGLNIEGLVEVCGELTLVIPPGKEGKKSVVYNLIAKDLMSKEEENDEGESAFQQIDAVLDRVLAARAAILAGKQKKVVKDEDGVGDSSTTVTTAEVKTMVGAEAPGLLATNRTRKLSSGDGGSADRVTVQYHKIREFKITGGVVGAEENALDLTDIQFQMKEGSDLGYTPREIRAGVIKAMKGGTEIRRYFERKVDQLDEEDFMEMLELWYTKKETSELMDTMSQCVQGPKETEKKYVVKMFEMRDHIMELTQKEEEPLGFTFVQKKMLRAISVGLRRDVVRLQMIAVLNEPNISDPKILKQLKEITQRDGENRSKMEKNGGKASVNSLQDHSDSGGGRRSQEKDREHSRTAKVQQQSTMDDSVLTRIETQLGQLSVTMSELTSSKSVVEERLKKLEDKLSADNRGTGSARRNRFPKCKDCERDNKFCTHCSKCGEAGHKNKDCPN